jgi:hypothetical protein
MELALSSDIGGLSKDAMRFIQTTIESNEEYCVDFDVLWRLCGHSKNDVAVRALTNLTREGKHNRFKKGGAFKDKKGRIIRKVDNSHILSVKGFRIFTLSVPKQRGQPLLRFFVKTGLKGKGFCGPQLRLCTEEALVDVINHVAASGGLIFKPDGP